MSRRVNDPVELERRQRDEELRQERFRLDMQAVLATPEGRRVLWWFLGACGLFETSFTGDSRTFFNEGKREIGHLLVKAMAQADPEALPTMMLEDIDNERRREHPDGRPE